MREEKKIKQRIEAKKNWKGKESEERKEIQIRVKERLGG